MSTIKATEIVKVTTLDNLDIGGNISVIKLDVEEHECHVLEGGINTIKQSLPAILFECWDHTEHKRTYVYDFFKKLQYNVFKVEHSSYLAIHCSKLKEYTWCNSLQKIF